MLPGSPRSLDEDFLWAGTGAGDPLSPRGLGRGLEERERARDVDRPPSEVVRVERSTHLSIPNTTAATTGDHQGGMLPEEHEGMSSGVGVETTKDAQFTW